MLSHDALRPIPLLDGSSPIVGSRADEASAAAAAPLGGTVAGASGRVILPLARRVVHLGLALGTLALLGLAAGLIGVRLLLGWYPMIVFTGSMAPTIPIGAVVIVQPVAAAQLGVGDVISFRAPQTGNMPVTHRIVEIEHLPATDTAAGGWQVITQGDANRTPDVWRVGEQQLTGRVILSIPSVGYLLAGIANPAVRNAIVAVIAVLVLARTANRLATGAPVPTGAGATRPSMGAAG